MMTSAPNFRQEEINDIFPKDINQPMVIWASQTNLV